MFKHVQGEPPALPKSFKSIKSRRIREYHLPQFYAEWKTSRYQDLPTGWDFIDTNLSREFDLLPVYKISRLLAEEGEDGILVQGRVGKDLFQIKLKPNYLKELKKIVPLLENPHEYFQKKLSGFALIVLHFIQRREYHAYVYELSYACFSNFSNYSEYRDPPSEKVKFDLSDQCWWKLYVHLFKIYDLCFPPKNIPVLDLKYHAKIREPHYQPPPFPSGRY